jgi:DNA replicative helicase MCM subunit Mcm2 (Cdc46/Mcm family)
MAMVERFVFQCDQCGHEWLREGDNFPQQCPKRSCRSRQWNANESKPVQPNKPASNAPQVKPGPKKQTISAPIRETHYEPLD